MASLHFDLPHELYSGSDSEQRRRRRDAQAKDRNLRGNPGSRRFRRFLNSVLSDYESDGDNSAASDAENERVPDRIIDFEWSGHFTQIGREFFDGTNVPLGVPRPNRAERERARARRRRHKQEHTHGGVDDEQKHVPRSGKSRLLREHEEMQALLSSASSPGANAKAMAAEDDKLEGKVNFSSPGSPREWKDDEADKEGAQDEDKSDDSDVQDGQDSAARFYTMVEQKYRKLFKKLTDTEFLHELEQVMIGFKSGRLTSLDATQLPLQQFGVLAESGDAEGEEKLTVTFHSSFGRLLCHGLAQFHRLIPSDGQPSGTDKYKTFLKRPRKGLAPHSASLCLHLQRLMIARKARQRAGV